MKFSTGFLCSLCLGLSATAAEVAKLTPTEAAKLVADGKAVLVDVREHNEWAETGVAAPALLLATTDFNHDAQNWKDLLAKVGGKTVILYCSAGIRAGRIVDKLTAKGIKAASMGKFEDWDDAGLPVRKVPGK